MKNGEKDSYTAPRSRGRKNMLKPAEGDKAETRQQFYDPESQRKKSRLRRIIGFAIAEVLVLSMIFFYAYALNQYSKIQRPDFNEQEVKNTNLAVESIKRMEGYKTIAIFGVDSRDNSVGKGWNSDVIMIASLNLANGEVRLVSIFRDTYLNLGNDKYSKINHAYATGGPEQALKAINKNLDLNITQYATFNWRAVATGINILGGVDVEISKPEFRYINSYITETVKSTKIGSVQLKSPGMNHLDGVQAVAYGRLRYMDSDLARTERQRKIIELALDKAKKADLKTLNDLLGNMLEMIGTNLTWQDGLDAIADVGSYRIVETMGFPAARGVANMGSKGQCIIPQTLESNVKVLHEFLFADADYQVSDTVKKISNRIAGDSGMYKEGKYIDHVPTDKGYIPNSDKKKESRTEDEDSSDSSKSSTKKKSTPEYGVHYETDEEGETIWLYETDEEGNLLEGSDEETLPTETLRPANESLTESGSLQEPGSTRRSSEHSSAGGSLPSGPSRPSASQQPSSSLHPSRPSEESTAQPQPGNSGSTGPNAPTTAPNKPTAESSTGSKQPGNHQGGSSSPGGPSSPTNPAPSPTTPAPTTQAQPQPGSGPGGEDAIIGEPKPQ